MTVGLIIIGDELLSGKRQDQHLRKVIEILQVRGLELAWAWMLGDDRARLTHMLRTSFAQSDPVLVSGGIGATPDDCTRQAAAAALDLKLCLHPEAAALITARWGEQAYPNRIHMAEFAEGARLIPNPVNQVAGFSLHDHHFVPGFPDMAWPMMEWVLDHYYRDRFAHQPRTEHLLRVLDAPESELIPAMRELLDEFEVKVSSLPSGAHNGEVELGVSGSVAEVAAATASLRQLLDRQGWRWIDLGPR